MTAGLIERRAIQDLGPVVARRLAERAGAVLYAPTRDRLGWIQRLLIVDKSGHIVPLRLNSVQRQIWALWEASRFTGLREEILKARQMGVSTLVEAFIFEQLIHVPNTRAVIVSRDTEETTRKLEMMKLFHRSLPDHERPQTKYDSKNEMAFLELNSHIYIGAAGNRHFGRGDTIQIAHCSEIAYWPAFETTIAGLQEAVPADGTIVLEYTANGAGTATQRHFEAAHEGRNSYRAVFIPWFSHEEYRVDDPEPLAPLENVEERADEARLRELYHVDDAQLRWRRGKKRDLELVEGGLFDQEYPESAEMAFLVSGRTRFDKKLLVRLQAMVAKVAPPVLEDSGHLRIWEQPIPGRSYAIGADTAEGLAGGDFSAAYVVDGEDGHEVAGLHGQWSPDVFADKLGEIGLRYNTAFIGVERNNHGHAVLQWLMKERNYPSVYQHSDYDMQGHQRELPGWPETTKTKPILEMHLEALMREHPDAFRDIEFVREAFGYVYHDDGSRGAQPGGYDDRVIARGIAHEMFAGRPGYLTFVQQTAMKCAKCGRGVYHPLNVREVKCPHCGSPHVRLEAAA